MALMNSIVRFANNDKKVEDVYRGMQDYYFHYMSKVEGKTYGDFDGSVSLEEKETKMHNALLSEVERVSGCPRNGMPVEAWSMSPQVQWATFAVTGAMIDSVLPVSIDKSIGLYTDIQTVGFGEVRQFDIQPNALFAVTRSANSISTSFNKKEYAISESLQAVPYQITVQAQLYKVLSGVENLARFVRKAIVSMETRMHLEAYSTLANLVSNASFPTQLKHTGFSMDDAITMAQTVETYNGGAKATFVGTKKAIYQMMPDASKGYRLVTDANAPHIDIIRGIFDWDIIELPQVATGYNYGLALDDDKVYIMSTGAEKVIKGVIEGTTLSHTSDFQNSGDLTSNATIVKRFGFGAISNSCMAVMTLN